MSMPPTREQHLKHVREEGGFGAHFYSPEIHDAEGNKVGDLEVEFCTTCGIHIATRCSHSINEWEKKNGVPETLRCKLCSADVT